MSSSISGTETSTVVNFVENTPHVAVITENNDVHVIAVSSLRNIVNGTYPPSNLGEDVLRRIIEEWLQQVEKK